MEEIGELDMINGVAYTYSNESIFAINAVLSPEKKDKIFSIGCSGCVPLSLTENAGKVEAYDYDEDQVKYGNARKYFISIGDYDKAFPLDSLEMRVESWRDNSIEYFFENSERLNKIRRNISNLEIVHKNIFDSDIDFTFFNKFYFSNALTFYSSLREDSLKFIKRLPFGALIYVSTSGEYLEDVSDERLVIDKPLTDLALEESYGIGFSWNPSVLRKVA